MAPWDAVRARGFQGVADPALALQDQAPAALALRDRHEEEPAEVLQVSMDQDSVPRHLVLSVSGMRNVFPNYSYVLYIYNHMQK